MCGGGVVGVVVVAVVVVYVSGGRLRMHQTAVIQQLKDRAVSSLKKRGGSSIGRAVSGGMALKLLGELLVCSVHTMPFFEMDLPNEALGRRLYYRSESLPCGFMFVRLYHVYLWQEQSVFLNYYTCSPLFQ